jgi:cephalosporin-C deacetylase
MTHNLATPWGDKCSPPQTPFLAFSSPQSEDLLFDSGEQIEMHCQAGLRALSLRWTLHRNRVEKPFREGFAEALPGNRFVIRVDTDGLHPGFYDLKVEMDTGVINKEKDRLLQRPVKGCCTFGWQADRMAIAETRPADFRAFWDKAMADYAAIPLDARIEGESRVFTGKEIDAYNLAEACLPPDYDPTGHRCEEVESYKISFAGPDGGRVYAWLAKPLGKGPFPAMLVMPGGGNAARPRPLEHARHGFLAIDVQIHGLDVNLEKYERNPADCAETFQNPPARAYPYNVNRRAARAVEYLCALPEVDPKRVVATGGSQGGRLSIVVAGLDPRVVAIVPTIAHFSNLPHLRWVEKCNRDAVSGMDVPGVPPVTDDDESRCQAYFDVMNFAPDVKCPAFLNMGLVDPVSHAYGVWAAYKRLGSADKTMVVLPGQGHDWSAEFDRRAWKWLDRTLSINPNGQRL